MILKCCLDRLRDDEAIFKSKTLFRNAPEALPSVLKAEDDWQSPNQTVNMLNYDSDTAAGLLLRWLSRLPEPLISTSRQGKFDAALAKYGSDHSKLIKKFALIIKSMHEGNCNSLHYLLVYLREVLAHSSHNGFTTESLAALFATPLTHAGSAPHAAPQPVADAAASSDAEASSAAQADSAPVHEKTQQADKIVSLLLKDFVLIFADLKLEDMETIPEEQLAEEARDAKAKRKNMIRSNSGSIEKPVVRSDSPYRKTMMFSSSADNLAPASPTVPAASTHMAAPTSPHAEAPSSPSKARPPPHPVHAEEDAEKEKDKKGFKSTLRKLGFGGKKDKDKSPSRSRSGSVSTSSPTPAARNAAAHSSPSGGTAPSSPHAIATEPVSPDAVFGMPYEKLLIVGGDGSHPDRSLPFILVDCFEYLKDESRAKEFGVFRESGSFNEKNRIKKAYDSPNVRIDFEGCDGYTVAAVTKEWLRALPECLLTDALYNEFKKAVADDSSDDDVAERLHEAVAKMPEVRRNALNYLIHFFKMHIIAHKEDNKMGESNVGIVMGPSLHRKENASPEELMDPCHNLIVTILLQRYETIFRTWDVPQPSAVDPPGTIYKKYLDMDKAASVLDDINRKMAQQEADAAAAAAAATAAANAPEQRSGSPAPDRSASPSKKDDDRREKTKRKGSGIWERIKEEATGGRRRSATTQSEVAPFAQEAPLRKISRSPSSKSNEPAPNTITISGGGSSPPASPLASPTALAISDVHGGSSANTSPPASPAPGASAESSPKASPRGETRKKSSSSNLTVITRPLPPVAESGDDQSASGAPASPTAASVAPASPTATIEAPIFTRRRSKKTNRVRELSTGSTSAEFPPPLPLLSSAQVELWLAENGFADLINQLRGNNGKQLFSFTRADLKEEFGMRGIALYNLTHPLSDNSGENSGETTPSSTSVTMAILSTQISVLTTKVEELLAKIGGASPRSPGAATLSNSSPVYAISDAAVSAALYPEKTSARTSPSASPRNTPSNPGTPQPVDMFGVAPPVPLDDSSEGSKTPEPSTTPEPSETPSTPSSNDSEPHVGHARYPTHEAPPVPEGHVETTNAEHKDEEKSAKESKPEDISLPLASTQHADSAVERSAPQIGVIEATPRNSRMELYDDASSSSSASPRS